MTPQEQPEEKCHCGKNGHALNSINCPVHGHPQEEWMEELKGLSMVIPDGSLKDCLVYHEAVVDFISTQLEAAEKRGRNEGESLGLYKAQLLANYGIRGLLPATFLTEELVKMRDSLTNHNSPTQ